MGIKSRYASHGKKPEPPEPVSEEEGPAKQGNAPPDWARVNAIGSVATALFTLIMAVSLSVLTFMQIRVQKAQNLPYLELWEEPNYSAGSQLCNRKTLKVHNLGAEAREFRLRWETYLHGRLPDEGEFEVPIGGYYSMLEPTGQFKGVICELQGINNYERLFALTNEMRQLVAKKSPKKMNPLSVKTYVAVRYRDRFGDLHNEYYSIEDGQQSEKEEERTVLAKIKKAEDLRQQTRILIFGELTGQALMQEIKSASQSTTPNGLSLSQ